MIIVAGAVIFLIMALYVLVQSSSVQRYLTQKIANHYSSRLQTRFHVGGVDIALFNKIVLKDVWLEDNSSDTLFYASRLTAAVDSFSVKRKFIAFRQIDFINAGLNLLVDSVGNLNYTLPEKLNENKTAENISWKISCSDFGFQNSGFNVGAGVFNLNKPYKFSGINFTVTGFKFDDDSISFKLDKLAFLSSIGFGVNYLAAEVKSSSGKTLIKSLNIKTSRSWLKEGFVEFNAKDTSQTKVVPQINFTVAESVLSLEDMAVFLPELKGMDEKVNYSGRIFGDFSNLKGRDISLDLGQDTHIKCNFYLNGISGNADDLYLFFDLENLQTTFADLSSISLPLSSPNRNILFPGPFYEAGAISFKGNFTGFLSDFVAYGKMDSKMGVISTDLSFVPGDEGKMEIDGKVSTSEFKLGSLFRNDNFGDVSFDGMVKGQYDKDAGKVQGNFEGGITNLEIRDYNYKNFYIDGEFNNRNFDGFVTIDDPNLNADFLGKVHLNPALPEFDFDLSVRHADMVALKIDSIHSLSDLAFISKAKFTGNSIDNLNGFIKIENGSYLNSNGEMTFQDIELSTEAPEQNRILSFNSDFLDARIDGQYNLKTLPATFRNILSDYLPALAPRNGVVSDSLKNNFNFHVEVKDLDKLTSVFKPALDIVTPFSIDGEIDREENLFNLYGAIPGISTENLLFKDIIVRSETNHAYNATLRIGEAQTRSGLFLYNLALNAEAHDDLLDTRLTWNNYDVLSYSGEVNTSARIYRKGKNLGADIDIIPSKIYVADSLLTINSGKVEIDSTSFHFKNLEMQDSRQAFMVDGIVSENPADRLKISVEDISLKRISGYLQQQTSLKGTITGDVELGDFYGNRLINSNLDLNGFVFEGQDFGNISLSSNWDYLSGTIQSNLNIFRRDSTRLQAHGYYNPKTDSLQFYANISGLSTVILQTIIRRNLSNFKGIASGRGRIYGTTDNILIDGALMGHDAGLTIDYTKVSYSFNDTVRFKKNQIIFDHIGLTDELGNKGIFNGTITHTNFSNMVYDLSFSSPKILALNTQAADNSQFFGKVIANGNFYITGIGVNVNLDGDGTTLQGTEVNISLDDEQEAEQYDFIRFVGSRPETQQEEVIAFNNKADTTMNLNLRIEVTPEARAQLIYNSQVGDIIRGQGEGVLQFGMDQNGDITIYGNYNIAQGDYLFTLKNVINKRFSIEPGGSINWSGDPYNANINIEANYKLKASLYELFANSNFDVDKSQRIPVECKIILTNDLTNPDIKFDVDFPLVETRLVDELQQFFNTDEEMNRQIISLVVLGQFYTPEYMRGTYEAATSSSYAIGSTASELFSNQFSNWLSQLSNDLDIGVNYRPGTQLTKDEIELALSKQMFNDRVTINGNIANNANPTTTNNSQIVGDFDLKVKLTDNGKIQLKAFNRSNNNLIYETAPYTQGIGLTFREEYNTFEELLDKLLSLVGKKTD